MSQCDELLALLMEAVKQQAAPGGEREADSGGRFQPACAPFSR